MPVTAPVEYAVAVDAYLGRARLSATSHRVYRVTLATWAWLLVGRTPPTGNDRRNATAPIVLLSRLDGPDAADRLRRAAELRARMIGPSTLQRELSILKSAAHFWTARGWLSRDAETALRKIPAFPTPPADDLAADESSAPELAATEPAPPVLAALSLPASLRELTLWHLIYESAAPLEHLLALDVSDLDLTYRRVRRNPAPRQSDRIHWSSETARLLPLLIAGRGSGPLFLTTRKANLHVPRADRCPYTGRARLSARRAAELFQAATKPLDPDGRGWALRDLRLAAKQIQRTGRSATGAGTPASR